MTDLQHILLGLLSRRGRGPAAGRKVWKIAEDLRALGLAATPRRMADALRALRAEGFAVVVTHGEFASAYLADRRRTRR